MSEKQKKMTHTREENEKRKEEIKMKEKKR